MKKVLLTAIAALTLAACSYGDDILDLQGQVGQLQRDLMQSDLNNAHLVAALQERAAQDLADAEARVALLATSLTEQAQAVLDTLNTDIAAIQADLDALDLAFSNAQADQSDANAIAALEDALEELEDDLEELEEDLEELNADVNTIVWTPTFSTQTAGFVQLGTSVTGTTSRSINIGTSSQTIVIDSVEHTHNVDINGDRDQADSIRRSYILYTHSGIVSGTTQVIGSHTVTGTLTPWIVIDNE